MNHTPSADKNYGFPYHAPYKKIPQINLLKFVGQKVVYYAGNKDKLDPRGWMGAFVGYNESNDANRM
jgi:hypothetical protein